MSEQRWGHKSFHLLPHFSYLLCCLLVVAQSATIAAELPADSKYADEILDDHPIAYWRFEDAKFETHAKSVGHGKIAAGVPLRVYDEDDLNDASAVSKGYVRVGQAGPRPEKFLAFERDNHAALFEPPTAIKFKDPGEKSLLDFDLGDSITLEAWVSVKRLGDGQQIYIVGKGRTKNAGVADDNQNYALRLTGQKKDAAISFLFRSADNRKGKAEDFHRWNSKEGFEIDGSWHHVAVSYTFGNANSVQGYIDGKPVEGVWDYGGATSEGPVVDDDELWIGSASALNPGNSFHGLIDEVAIYRAALPAERIAARWRVLEPKPYITTIDPPHGKVLVEVFEGIPDKSSWDFVTPEPTERYEDDGFALIEIAQKYTPRGIRADRSNPYFVRVTGDVEFPKGESRVLVRSRRAARLFIDGKLVVANPFPPIRGDGHNPVYPVDQCPAPGHRALRPGDQDTVALFNPNANGVGAHADGVAVKRKGGTHRLTWEVTLGGKGTRPELGETCVAIARPDSDTFEVLHLSKPFPLTDDGWVEFAERERRQLQRLNQIRRAEASRAYAEFWNRRHEYARKQVAKLLDSPPDFGEVGLQLADDWTFLRRVSLDTIGTIPSAKLIDEFFALPQSTRRKQIIDRLLADDGWADHWVGYWQDVLAENPNIINPTLNNTGPFRWWIHESFLDNKPFDRFVTELILMDGSERFGGTAGFATASQNDAPFAAKAHIVGQAFLGLEMKCARCHDAPYHDFEQRDLFSLAALLKREPQAVPKTSTVPDGTLAALGREPLVKVTLKPGTSVPAEWPFAELVESVPDQLVQNPKDSRERLAAFITSPHNRRFAQVIVNRIWHRLMGWGFVEPVDDWDGRKPSHLEALEWLERELVLHDYDLKHVMRFILNSRAYQSVARSRRDRDSSDGNSEDAEKTNRKPDLGEIGLHSRRLSAEQLIDSLFVAAGKQFHVEDMNIDVDGGRSLNSSITLGPARRAWQFTSMSNERDRPSLSLPAAQTIVNVLESFGWRPSRPDPVTTRSNEVTLLQPAMLANGVIVKRISQLSDDSAFTDLALSSKSLDELIDGVVHRILTRPPTNSEREVFRNLLNDGFESRIVPGDHPIRRSRHLRPTGVSWSNHLKPEANLRKIALAEELESGDPTTSRLNADWRERAEDMIWSLINSPEFLFVP